MRLDLEIICHCPIMVTKVRFEPACKSCPTGCLSVSCVCVISCVKIASVLVFPCCTPCFQLGLAKSTKGQWMVHRPLDTITHFEYTYYITNPQYSIQSRTFPFSRRIRPWKHIQQLIPTNITPPSTHITTCCTHYTHYTCCTTMSHHAEQQC